MNLNEHDKEQQLFKNVIECPRINPLKSQLWSEAIPSIRKSMSLIYTLLWFQISASISEGSYFLRVQSSQPGQTWDSCCSELLWLLFCAFIFLKIHSCYWNVAFSLFQPLNAENTLAQADEHLLYLSSLSPFSSIESDENIFHEASSYFKSGTFSSTLRLTTCYSKL